MKHAKNYELLQLATNQFILFYKSSDQKIQDKSIHSSWKSKWTQHYNRHWSFEVRTQWADGGGLDRLWLNSLFSSTWPTPSPWRASSPPCTLAAWRQARPRKASPLSIYTFTPINISILHRSKYHFLTTQRSQFIINCTCCPPKCAQIGLFQLIFRTIFGFMI